jgi:hypothetical protein
VKLNPVILPVLLLLASCASVKQGKFHPSNKKSAEMLKSDLVLLKKILEANHPSLYWYTPKDSVDYYFHTTVNSITDSLTELQFRNKVAYVVGKLRCGHTAVRASKDYTKYYTKQRLPQFPLLIKIWNDSAVIINNAFKTDSVLKRGTVVTAINRYSNSQLADSMFQFISTDGYADNFKQQLISFNYPLYYRNTFGLDSQYTVHYIDSLNNKRTAVVKNFVPIVDTTRKRQIETQPRLTKKEIRRFTKLAKRNMVIDTTLNTAFIYINTFVEGKLNSFFRRSFRKIKEQHVKNVVIDLRENSGGNVISSTRLTQYLIDKPFHIADTVAAINRSFPYKRHIRPWFIYWLSMRFTGRKQSDGRIHFRYFEKHNFKPKARNHFDGHVYLVAGGFSFSASTLVVGALKGQQNVSVVGEETGGGYYGNTAMHLPVVTLPVSKVRVVLPMYRMVIDKNRPKTGRGIFPDVPVTPSSMAIKRGIDAKMDKVKELIKNDQRK